MSRCTGTLVHYSRTVVGRVARPGRRMQLVCTGTPVNFKQTVMERLTSALSMHGGGFASGYGYTCTR